jgi:hypothetical protein
MIRIRIYQSKQSKFGRQVRVESIPVWIDCVDLKIFSSEPGAPEWYFERLYFRHLNISFKKLKKTFVSIRPFNI